LGSHEERDACKVHMHNLALLERYHADPVGSRRQSRWMLLGFGVWRVLLVCVRIAIPALLIRVIVHLAS
jgi:hypothetical protein